MVMFYAKLSLQKERFQSAKQLIKQLSWIFLYNMFTH